MRPPRVISLDLDDTLWPIWPVIETAEREMYAWLAAHHPRMVENYSIEKMRTHRNEIAERYPEQSHDLTFQRVTALKLQALESGCPESAAEGAFAVLYAARNRVVFYDDAIPALQRLSRRFRLYAVSNGNADLSLCGIARYFEGHLMARTVGAAKPDERIYRALLQAADVENDEIVHVGDDPLADVAGAARAGIAAYWINREARDWPADLPPPQGTVASLLDLLRIFPRQSGN
jgi:FMN hydrolase / 5-amino-6-(5-phospho-D-ribitylamino)uracil phosphatase